MDRQAVLLNINLDTGGLLPKCNALQCL